MVSLRTILNERASNLNLLVMDNSKLLLLCVTVYDPRMPPNKKGVEDDNFTLNIDLAPTILNAAGIPKPDTYQGRDIADLYLRGRVSPPWRTEFYYEHPVHIHQNTIPASSALVRKNIKYVNWPNFDVSTSAIASICSTCLQRTSNVFVNSYVSFTLPF